MSDEKRAEKLFADIEAFISQSRTLLEERATAELAGMDEQVLSLCESVLMLAPEVQAQYSDKLKKLLGDLKDLGDELVRQRDAVAEEILATPHYQKANVAYRIADSRDEFGKKKKDE